MSKTNIQRQRVPCQGCGKRVGFNEVVRNIKGNESVVFHSNQPVHTPHFQTTPDGQHWICGRCGTLTPVI